MRVGSFSGLITSCRVADRVYRVAAFYCARNRSPGTVHIGDSSTISRASYEAPYCGGSRTEAGNCISPQREQYAYGSTLTAQPSGCSSTVPKAENLATWGE
jgi:hypothetical protein